MLSSDVIELTRAQALAFFKADPEHFDLIFVANATAAIKLVMGCFSDHSRKATSWYSYHVDSHTSLVGVREAVGVTSRFFKSDEEVNDWTHVCLPCTEQYERTPLADDELVRGHQIFQHFNQPGLYFSRRGSLCGNSPAGPQ